MDRGGAAITVSDAGEFGLIARIAARLGTGASDGVLVGPGDDAAVVTAPDGRVVVTTDLTVEGRHFRLEWSSPYDVGRRAAARRRADGAAMGGRATPGVVALAAPPDQPREWADGLADGLRDECALVGAVVVGGDVSADDHVTIAVTALGDLAGRSPVLRAGAVPGDVVVVAGRLGYAAAGLALLQAGRADEALAGAHRRPQVAYAAAARLAAAGATAMVDVSDGLVADLGHVAAASGVRIELATDDLPLPADLVEAALALGVDPMAWVAGGGDDHAFAATMPGDAALRAVTLLADLPEPVPFAQVGRVVAGAGVTFVDAPPPGVGGHEHWRA
ncbi:MAG: thiamine-monophosphate kinase [Frankiaceae bacterium]|nr:thiamine-monophosphate kinase [Frankiaceae bacterium]